MTPLDTKHVGLIKKILLCSSAQPILVGTGTKIAFRAKWPRNRPRTNMTPGLKMKFVNDYILIVPATTI